MKVARLTLSDRASAGVYEDRSGPEIERIFAIHCGEIGWVRLLLPDDREQIEEKLRSVGIGHAEIHEIGPSLEDVFVTLSEKHANEQKKAA